VSFCHTIPGLPLLCDRLVIEAGDLVRHVHLLILCLLTAAALPLDAGAKPAPVTATRLYVLNCGGLIYNRPEDYGLTREEVATSNMAVTCYLIVHPKGTLLFDTGLEDRLVGQPFWANVDEGYAQEVTAPLRAQLAAIGFSPSDITYLALSHSDWDHVGNANDYASSVWLTPKAERDFMFRPEVPANRRRTYDKLEQAKSVIYSGDHDVFGDGEVILKATPGHTPGHQSLYVHLAKTGGVVLSGDLYHYAEERTLHRMPEEEKTRGTPESRAAMETFLSQTHSQLWIGHSIAFFVPARKPPEFYE
jgi:glyoxylase-like metal-dependent hydrolase (beta-lactamase superfamily II)